MSGTDLVRKASIEELCGHRDRALELYRQAAETLVAAQAAHARALVGQSHASEFPHQTLRWMGARGPAGFADECRTVVDRDMWRAFIVGTPLGGLMDAEERKKFEDSLTGHKAVVPEANPDNVEATMRRLAGDAGNIFRRGLVNVFKGLCGEYRSHDGFKIGKRMVLNDAFNTCGHGLGLGRLRKDDVLRDADRVMHVLDGQPPPTDYNAGLCGAIRGALKGSRSCETPYWRVRWFENGNLHLYPLRADLVEKANKLIAEHYGAAVGTGPDARKKAV